MIPCACLFSVLASTAPVLVPAQQEALESAANSSGSSGSSGTDSWSFVLEPYLWLAGVDGSASADSGPTTSVNVVGGFESAFMMRLEARAPRFGPAFLVDGLTLNLKDDEGSLQTKTGADMIEFGVALPLDERAGIEVVAGLRYVDLEFEVELGGIDAGDARATWVDPWIGLRGTVPIGGDWSMRYRGDVGGFGVGSDFTWQAALGVGYAFSEHVRLDAGYRALSLDFDDDDLEYDALIHGPALSLVFAF